MITGKKIKMRNTHQSKLNEGNPLSRIFTSVKDDDLVMVIITASRNNKSDDENDANNAELRRSLRQYGFGYRKAEGHYPEEYEGRKISHIDDSSIIIASSESEDDLFELSCYLCRKYEQECFVYKDSEGYVSLVDQNGNKISNLGRFHPNRIDDYMTRVKMKPFVFETISEYNRATPASYSDALLIRNRRKSLRK